MTTETTVFVEFELVAGLRWKVLGARDMESATLGLVAPPSYFAKDEIVTLSPECKYPLDDYRDMGRHSQHSYVFVKADGSQQQGILDGFTYNATHAGAGTCNAQPRVMVAMRKVDSVIQSQTGSNAREDNDSEGVEGASVD
jgi:hypothetical protein